MPARLVQVTLRNKSRFPIRWLDDGRPHGSWQDPWYPSNISDLKTGEEGTFRSESDGILTGTQAWALFKLDIPANNIGDRTEFIRLSWEKPYVGFFERHIEHWIDRGIDQQNRVQLAHTVETELGHLGSNENILGQIAASGIITPITALWNDALGNHVRWVVEVQNIGETSTLPLQVQAQGVIYVINHNNDLVWFRHDGRGDGSFQWLDTNARKVGVGWDMKHVFSGGDGVIYAINQNNDLLWFRHDGRGDGSFQWLDTNARKVGVGWDMKHVFSGGDGVIYAINQNNDLLWFRHDGRGDGSFRWLDTNARKVGVGWDMKHVFSGGDGVIYAINQNNDLLWFRHDGRGDGSFQWLDTNARKVGVGWDMKHVFSGGDGVIYAINHNNDLVWFRHDGRGDGSFRWLDTNARKVGVGWDMKQVFSG